MGRRFALERWNTVSGGNEKLAPALRRGVAGSKEQAANVTLTSVVNTSQCILRTAGTAHPSSASPFHMTNCFAISHCLQPRFTDDDE